LTFSFLLLFRFETISSAAFFLRETFIANAANLPVETATRMMLLQKMSARENPKIDQQTETQLFPFWVEDWGLSFFLGFLVIAIIFVPMVTLSRSGRLGLGLMFALMLFASMR